MTFDWCTILRSLGLLCVGAMFVSHVREERAPAIVKRQRVLWEAEAAAHGADLARVQVWDAFSVMYLDGYRNDGEIEWLAEIIADSPFPFAEIRHILYVEVGPVCFPNLLSIAGEWAGFDPDWLIGKCMNRQKKFPFREGKRVPLLLEWNPFCFEASLLLARVKRLRSVCME
jgi:hypothetical protein